MVTRLCLFLAARRRRSSSRLLQMVEAAVPLDRPRDLEAGRAQQPDALPDLPVDRHHDLRREQAVVAASCPAADRRCRCRGSCVLRSNVRDSRKDVLEKSALMIDSPSATIVPAADRAQVRALVLDTARRSSTRSGRSCRGRTRWRAGSTTM